MDASNIREVEPGLFCGGQPSEAELGSLMAQGVRSLINLRPPGEFDGFDEARAAAALGLAYTQIGITGSADLTREKIGEFCSVFTAARAAGPVLVYCRSGNRVGAAIALALAWMHQCCPDEALARGRRAGMTGLEEAVKTLLGDDRT